MGQEDQYHLPSWITMCSNPWLNSGCTEGVDTTPDLGHLGEIGLLGDPLEHLDPVLERDRVSALWRKPVPHGDDNGITELSDPPVEGVVGHARCCSR